MQFLNTELFQNGITDETFAKTHGVIVLYLFGTTDMSTVQTGTLRLECTFCKPVMESIVYISQNQFEIPLMAVFS